MAVWAGQRRRESGASAVEFALVLPLLVVLLLGVTTAGVSYNKALGTTDAIREGARYGATALTTPAPAGGWVSAVQQKTVSLSAGTIPGTSNVCVKLTKGPSASVVLSSACSFSANEPATPTGLAATDCVVKVWAKVPFTINTGIAVWNNNIVRASVARYERTCT